MSSEVSPDHIIVKQYRQDASGSDVVSESEGESWEHNVDPKHGNVFN